MDSFQDLKNKYLFHSQKQIERAKKASRHSKLMEAAERSNCKLLALKKELKIKMDQKKKEKYEKRLLMYKIANEENEADYEKFFDEDENENKDDKIKENDMEQDLNDENSQLNLDEDNDSKESESNLNEKNDSQSQSNEEEDEEDKEEENESDDESKSMDYTATPTELINENRDLLTKMINRETQSQLNNEDLLGLCSAKVSSFIDDECEEDDSMMLDDNNLEDDEDNESEQENNDLNMKNKDKNKDDQDDLTNKSNDEQKEEEFDVLKERLKRQKELESDSDEEEFSFVSKFKFKKTCKLDESDDEETNSKLNFKNKFNSIEEQLNSNDIYDDLNSQDSQLNNRESTFIESKIDLGKPRFNLKEFIEDQAELSEEDKDKFSSDEEEDSNDEYEQDEIDENLPSEEEILKENNKIFMKQQMDEDRREILEYQERFLEFGDLHDDGDARQRRFKWKNVDNVWVDNVKDSSDSDEFDIQDSQIEFTSLHLKQIDEMNKSKEGEIDESQPTQSSISLSKEEKRKKKLMNTSLNKTHLSSYSTFDNSIFNKHMRTFKRTLNGPANDIQSYIIKDKNLVNAMSVKSNVVAANKQTKSKQQLQKQMDYVNKKRKTDKIENKKSIFDLF